VSSSDDAALVCTCLDAGAMSFIPKSAAPKVLTNALGHVLPGSVYLPPRMLDREDDLGTLSVALSPRQRDVLRGLCRGLSTKSIARNLSLSDHTVKEYITAIFRLLDVHNRTEAVIKASQTTVDNRSQPKHTDRTRSLVRVDPAALTSAQTHAPGAVISCFWYCPVCISDA
jgi:DNA-binding NarL/FixJ family response regulator